MNTHTEIPETEASAAEAPQLLPSVAMPRPRAERAQTDTEILNAVLETQGRIQDVLFEVADIMKARGARKAELLAAFEARHAGAAPSAALDDAALQLLGLRVKTEQARKDAEWIRAMTPKKIKTPKPKAPPRRKRRQARTLEELRSGNY